MDPEKYIIQTLSSMGFDAQKIEEGEIESPDFIVRRDESNYLIELKTKLDDPDKIFEKEKILKAGQVHDESTNIAYQNTVAKRVKKASTQLTSVDVEVDFRIIWLLANGANPDIQMEQFEMTLFGAVNMIDMDDDSGTLIPCYYFDESSFYRHRSQIDAAVISTTEKAKLCINNHSPNYVSFSNSELRKAFGDGVIDPKEKEVSGDAYIVDGEVDRNNKRIALKYVQEKYDKPRLIDLNFTHYSASILVPTEK